jgi:hypothetical protein
MYGPGYQTKSILDRGLASFLQEHGPFDIVAATEHIVFSKIIARKKYVPYGNSYAKPFESSQYLYGTRIYDELLSYGGKKLVILLESDFFNFTSENILLLDQLGGYCVGWGLDFIESLNNLSNLGNETFCSHATDNWYDYLQKNSNRIVSLPEYVAETEFCWSPLANRGVDWSVVGADYWARKVVREIFDSNHIEWNGKRLRIFYKLLSNLNRIGIAPFTNNLMQTLINDLFRTSITQSKYTFTCGSRLRYPIRKFYEIPALGSVMVTDPCKGIEALGFRHNESIIVTKPEDILEVYDLLRNNPDFAQSLATKARELVWQKHTTSVRSRQVKEALDRILSKSYKGNCWVDGEMRFV